MILCHKCQCVNLDAAEVCQNCGSPFATSTTIQQVRSTPVATEVPITHGWTRKQQEAVAVVAILLTVAVLGILVSTSHTLSGAPPYQPSWRSIGSYSGGSDSVVDTVTNTFQVNGTQLRILWQYTTQFPQYSVFGFYVYKSGSTIDLWCQSGDTTDFASCDYSSSTAANGVRTYESPGDFQFRVLHANMNWTITIQSYN